MRDVSDRLCAVSISQVLRDGQGGRNIKGYIPIYHRGKDLTPKDAFAHFLFIRLSFLTKLIAPYIFTTATSFLVLYSMFFEIRTQTAEFTSKYYYEVILLLLLFI